MLRIMTRWALQPGTHNFQCCIHPWMRTTVKIKAEEDQQK